MGQRPLASWFRRLRFALLGSLPGLFLAGLLLWKAEHVGFGLTLVHAALTAVAAPIVFSIVALFQSRLKLAADGTGGFVLTPGASVWAGLLGCAVFCVLAGFDTFVLHPVWRPSPVDRSGVPVALGLFLAGLFVCIYAAGERVRFDDEGVERRVFGRLVARYRWDEIDLAGSERWTGYVWLAAVGGPRLRISPRSSGFARFNDVVQQKLGRLRPVGPEGLPPRRSAGPPPSSHA